jgi:hypothetical protein
MNEYMDMKLDVLLRRVYWLCPDELLASKRLRNTLGYGNSKQTTINKDEFRKVIKEAYERYLHLWEEAARSHAETGIEGYGALADVRSGYRDALEWVLKILDKEDWKKEG